MAAGRNGLGGGRHRPGSRFIEACILCLLQEEAAHGYSLLEKLDKFDFENNPINISVIYRNLHNLEHQGWVNSFWVESEIGPKKRMYSLTSAGEKALENWVALLKARKKKIEAIIDKYESIQ